jgi:hemerythrin
MEDLIMVEWNNKYKLGLEEIDKQHKKLFDLAEEIYNLLKSDLIVDKYNRIVDLINELRDYTAFHFSEEEKYMESIKYKKLFTHKMEHLKFIDTVTKIDLDKIDENQDAYILELLDFVTNWIDNHILHTDLKIIEK